MKKLLCASLVIGFVLFGAPVANADSTGGESAAPSGGEPLVPAEAGPQAEVLPLEAETGGLPQGGDELAPRAASASICQGEIDYPHVSGTKGVTYTINTHLKGKCRAKPSTHDIAGSLYRSRWYGWEHLKSDGVSKAKASLQLNLNKKCKPNTWFKYRASGRFYAKIGKTTWSRSFYNQNPKEIKCKKNAKA
ncbi:hypothetical protein [Nocardiopsis composta]|uniref:Uncharacterized protein n=1 Tax=Nocardiopsis composta TaxID=157465 RepID=A0A7W8VE46_9ACTN|nr:hypothetical protein [Nocardiopsis composta]MBB5432683.1 hypothetical protein [Nocardiopsis composta]